MIVNRRSFFLGATAFLAAPSIVRAASLMPVSVVEAESAGVMLTTAGPLTLAHIRALAKTLQRNHAAVQSYYAAPYAFTDKIVNLYDDMPVTADASCHSPRDGHEAA